MSEAFNFKSDVSQNAGNFNPLPEARYNLKVTEADFTKSKDKGTPQIAVVFQVMDEPYKNRKLFHNFTWTAKSAPFVFNFLKAIKSSLVDSDGVTPEQVAASIVGGQCNAFVEIEKTLNGNDRNKASGFKEIPGSSAPVAQNTSAGSNPSAAGTTAGTDKPMFK